MKQFIGMGSIPQFRHAIKHIVSDAQFVRYDKKAQQVIIDRGIVPPVLKCIGYEKIHGTNASVCYNDNENMWVQSRKNIIDAINNQNYTEGITDNAGCAFAVYQRKEQWMLLIEKFKELHSIDTSRNTIVLYYEWCGGNIQKKSAITGLDKRAILFSHGKVVNNTNIEDFKWLSTETLSSSNDNIHNIRDFPYVEIEIDFSNPILSQNKMVKMVEALERNSLVGAQLGIEGNVGEGYVFETTFKDKFIQWKVKGEEHSKGSGKVKTLSPVNQELEQKKIDFVNNIACKEWRLDQMYNELTVKDKSSTGDYLRAVVNDVIKEESDIMQEQELEPKSVNSMISRVARDYFFSRLNNDI